MASSSVAALGTLTVNVLETRDISINFIVARVDFTSKLSEVKKSHSSHHQFTDVFNFRVTNTNSELDIEGWRKNILFKDKLEGLVKLPVKDFLDEQVHSGWFTMNKPAKGAASTNTAKGESSRQRSASVSEGSGKKNGEVRLEIKFSPTAPAKETLPGIVLKDLWTADTAGGSLINNPHWVKNPQFLLSVVRSCPISVKLRLHEEAKTRASFYVVKYDDFYNGRQKVVLDTSEIIKVDNFFCPISSQSVDATLDLDEGEYIVVPFPETPGYCGEFTLAVSTKDMDNIDLVKLPKSDNHKWKEFELDGEWTEENSGGGDILGLEWRKNPQYLLTLTKASDVCIVLRQEENSMSIGFYIVKQIDVDKKVVDYEEEVAKTESFKSLCSTGVMIAKLPEGNFVIIASTFEPGTKGKYHLYVYSDDHLSTVTPLTTEWCHRIELKGEWKDETAGGSPNNPTFTNNPQFRLCIPQVDHGVKILVQLVQESSHFEETGIGFLVIKRSDEGKQRLGEGDVRPEDIRAKPAGWMQKIDVVCRTAIEPGENRVYTIIPSTFKAGVNRSFYLNVFSDDQFLLDLI
jgi:hypothetical protein